MSNRDGPTRGVNSLPDKACAVFLMGPTASGKTELAVKLVQEYPFEIISVDSALVYRGMDIGTAKPDSETLRQAPHRLIDILDPAQVYSAANFCQDARQEMDKIHARGKVPLLVGGTMLYFRALQQGLSELPAANAEVRQSLDETAARIGWEGMHQRLFKVDPESAHRIHPNDPQRIQRALEVHQLTGKSMSEFYRQTKSGLFEEPVLKWVITPQQREVLHQRIEKRFEQMLKSGFIEEVERLHSRSDLHPDLPSMRAVGYRQIWAYLEGQLNFEEMKERAVIATRQLAKRQMTWLRSETNAQWLSKPDDLNESGFKIPLEKLFG